MAFSNHEYLNFVVDCYQDILAIQEIMAQAKDALPDEVSKFLHRSMVENHSVINKQLPGFAFHHDAGEHIVWWATPAIWDAHGERGWFFGLWIPDFEAIAGSNPTKPIMIYVWSHSERHRESGRFHNALVELISKHRSALNAKGIETNREVLDHEAPACLDISRLVNIAALKHPKKLAAAVSSQVVAFTKILYPLMSKASPLD